MSKSKGQSYKFSFCHVFLFLLFLVFSASLFFNIKSYSQKEFLKGISAVHMINTPGGNLKKVVYYTEKYGAGDTIYLINQSLDKSTAIKIAEGTTPQSLAYQVVNRYYTSKTYIIVQNYLGEGDSDYIVFDENGRIITKHLLADNKNSLPKNQAGNSILNTRDDGVVYIQFNNLNNSKDLFSFDLTIGKINKNETIYNYKN